MKHYEFAIKIRIFGKLKCEKLYLEIIKYVNSIGSIILQHNKRLKVKKSLP